MKKNPNVAKQFTFSYYQLLELMELNRYQRKEIKDGLEKGIDVSLYMRSVYNYMQMREIKNALLDDISKEEIDKYMCNPSLSCNQMELIRKGLEDNLDVTSYSDPKFNYEQSKEIYDAIIQGIDPSIFVNESYDHFQMHYLKLGLEEGLDVTFYSNPKFDSCQMKEIYLGLKDHLDVSAYADPKYGNGTMKAARIALHDKAVKDVSTYIKLGYKDEQLIEILDGIEYNVQDYITTDFSAGQIKAITYGLKAGLDVTEYNDIRYSANAMMLIAEQMKKGDVNINLFAKPEFGYREMDKILEGIKEGLNVSYYNKPGFDYLQMEEIRLALKYGWKKKDIKKFANPAFNLEQMRQIKSGIKEGLDVSKYADPSLTSSEMLKVRKQLRREKEKV